MVQISSAQWPFVSPPHSEVFCQQLFGLQVAFSTFRLWHSSLFCCCFYPQMWHLFSMCCPSGLSQRCTCAPARRMQIMDAQRELCVTLLVTVWPCVMNTFFFFFCNDHFSVQQLWCRGSLFSKSLKELSTVFLRISSSVRFTHEKRLVLQRCFFV